MYLRILLIVPSPGLVLLIGIISTLFNIDANILFLNNSSFATAVIFLLLFTALAINIGSKLDLWFAAIIKFLSLGILSIPITSNLKKVFVNIPKNFNMKL